MMCRDTATFVCIATTYCLFLIFETTSSSLKHFIDANKIQRATGPIAEKNLYVDKTHLAQELCEHDGGRYFFVRPRRFGKSTFLATLFRIFDGSKNIFEGTHIYDSNYTWNQYPVLYIDMGGSVIDNCSIVLATGHTLLEKKIRNTLVNFTKKHKLWYPEREGVAHEFARILEQNKEEKGELTVVLIDEYDFSILNNMANNCSKAVEINTAIVRNLFLELKHSAQYIKFAFVTGISKSVISTLGSSFDLEDITGYPDFHEIAGLTESDLKNYYGDHIKAASDHMGIPESNVTEELTKWYDGYNFSTRVQSSLYNPLSVHSYLKNKEAKGYWADKDHARFLYTQMVYRPEQFSCLDIVDGVQSELRGSRSLNVTDPVVLLYDAGYLTIQSFSNGYYTLGFPNHEMERAFYKDIADAALEAENGTGVEVEKIRRALGQPIPNFKSFMNAINSGIPKLGMRAPFEEWYDWQTMLFMRYAGIQAERQCKIKIVPNSSNENKTSKIVDVTGSSEHTFFLFEVKFERQGCSEAWNDAKESIQVHLDRNKKKTKPLNILAAGFTFTGDRTKKPVVAYKAKLFAPDGQVLKKYFSSTKVKDDPKSDESFLGEKTSTTN